MSTITVTSEARVNAKWTWKASVAGVTYACDADDAMRLPVLGQVAEPVTDLADPELRRLVEEPPGSGHWRITKPAVALQHRMNAGIIVDNPMMDVRFREKFTDALAVLIDHGAGF